MANVIDQYSPMQSALALLQPTVSYAQKRADADRNLYYQQAMTQQAVQDKEQARQQALLLQQQQAQLMSVPFLEKDQERWRGLVDGIRKKIKDRVIDEFGGDYESYARTMLEQDTQGLSLEAQRSPLYASALERRSNLLQAQKDMQDGKIARSVQYQLTNGKTKVAPWEQAYLDFNNGLTEQLPYNGGFKVSGKWRDHFDKVYSPRVDKLGKFRPDQATLPEIAASLIGTEGLTASDAAEYLQRTGPMIGPVYYKFENKDPYKEEELRQGRERNSIARQRNQIASDKNKVIGKALGGQLDLWDATFNNPDNIITRNADRSPGAINVTMFDDSMQRAGNGKLQGFTGKAVGPSLLESTGAVYDKKEGTWQGAGGKAYVSVKNSAGGVDLRSTDLTGLDYTTKPGNVYRYETPPSEHERSTGKKPYQFMQEQTITISSDAAKKARSGKLFGAILPGTESFSTDQWLSLGNTDTPTGKGGYTEVTKGGKKYYQFKILQPVNPTQLDRSESSFQRMETQGKAGQAVLMDAGDDLDYLP